MPVICSAGWLMSLCVSADLHYVDHGPRTLQYLVCVDAINFCFWPQPGLEYEHLARGLKVRDGVTWLYLKGITLPPAELVMTKDLC